MPSLNFPPDFRISNLKAFTVSVGTSAVEILGTAANVLPGFVWMVLYNNSSNNMYYAGDSSVTTSSGFPLKAGESVTLPATNAPSFDPYVIADGSSSDLRVILYK